MSDLTFAFRQLLKNPGFTQVSPLDPVSLLLGPAALLIVATLACWLPARQAAKVDPMEALRSE